MTIEDIAENVLGDWGLQPVKLPTTTHQTPDFLCCDGFAKYLIEIKTKESGVKAIEEKEKALDEQGFHVSWQSNRRTNTLSGIAGNAAAQLRSYNDPIDFRLVWFLAIGEKSKRWFDKFVATLYGTIQLANFGKTPLTRYPCYFFGFSDFFRHKDILDGAIISYPESGSLENLMCLNPHSERYSGFRDSNLVSLFGTSVVDPFSEEVAGTAYIADSQFNRRDLNAMLEHVRNKYALPQLDIAEMSTLSMEARTRISDD